MKRLTNSELKKINVLIEKGNSLNKIHKELNKSKTTIYYHFRKRKGLTTKRIEKINKDEKLLGEFLGLFAGDGYLDKTKDYKYRIFLFFNKKKEKEYTNLLIKNVLLELFNKKPMVIDRKNVIALTYYSKIIYKLVNEYLNWDKSNKKTYSIELRNKKHSVEFMKGFIRGSLDSDGYLSKNKISFATVSPGLAEDISLFLTKLGIKHSKTLLKEKRENRKDIFHLFISRYDHKKFMETIKPRNTINLSAPAGI